MLRCLKNVRAEFLYVLGHCFRFFGNISTPDCPVSKCHIYANKYFGGKGAIGSEHTQTMKMTILLSEGRIKYKIHMAGFIKP